MNERIKELAAQACDIMPLYDSINRGDYTHSQYNMQIELLLEKFAEMIVLECAFYMYENYPHSRYEVNYMRRHMGDADWNKPIKDQLELNDERTN